MASSERAARSDSLIEEVKGLKGHRLGMPKMMFRQLATERFTEPHEAIVMQLLKQTPTLGGLVAWDLAPACKREPHDPLAIGRRRLRFGGASCLPLWMS